MTRHWLSIGGSFLLGLVLGAAICETVAVRGAARMIDAGEAKYTHAMFCYAPASAAQHALEERIAMLKQQSNVSDLNKKEIALVRASLSLTLDRLGNSGAEKSWQETESECRQAKYSDCSRQKLERYAQATCQSR